MVLFIEFTHGDIGYVPYVRHGTINMNDLFNIISYNKRNKLTWIKNEFDKIGVSNPIRRKRV